MTKEDLIQLKQKISQLSEKEKKERDLYLRGLTAGEIQGPPTGYASIDKPWLKYYPKKGITTDVSAMTAYELIYNKMKNKQNYIALNYFGRKISYKELFKNIERVAKSLKANGVKKGDIVTMAMPTSPETVYLFYALNRIGAISNCVDPRMTTEGFKDTLKSTNSQHLITLDMCEPIISEVVKEMNLDTIISVSPVESAPLPIKLLGKSRVKSKFMPWDEFIKSGKNYCGKIDEPYEKDTPATIVHTGGTTGTPKGVVLTNDNFNTMAVTQEISNLNLEEKDKFLTFLPPFTAYCLVNAIHDPLYLGFENVLIPKFEVSDFPKLMKKYRPNHVLSGPILWDAFIKSPLHQNENLSYMKSPISGGDALNIELEKQINKFFEEHGSNVPIAQGYGMSEVSAAAVYSKKDCYKTGSVGIPYVKNNIGIFNPDTGEEMRYNEEGEICIATPTLMLEYYNNQTETEKVIEVKEDGSRWIHTGDIGKMDEDGNIYIVGRMKRMIVRNGNKLFPSNIENIMMRNPAIDSCAIVQMEDEVERHVPIAHVVLKPEFAGMENEIISTVEQEIAAEMPDFNIPSTYVFRDELPLTDLQKIDFKQLEADSKDYIGVNGKVNFRSPGTSRQFKKNPN